MNVKKISFDYDDTLDRKSAFKLAKTLIQSKKFEVWIVTSRSGDLNTNQDIKLTAKKLGIPKERCVFVGDWKVNWFKDHPEFDIHIDDYFYEIDQINTRTEVLAIPVNLKLFFNDWARE